MCGKEAKLTHSRISATAYSLRSNHSPGELPCTNFSGEYFRWIDDTDDLNLLRRVREHHCIALNRIDRRMRREHAAWRADLGLLVAAAVLCALFLCGIAVAGQFIWSLWD